LKNTSLDELILLLHESIPGSYGRRWNQVRPVIYGQLDEVPALLLADPSATRTITHQRQPRAGAAIGAQPDDDYDRQEQGANVPQERIAEENEAEEGVGSREDRGQEVDEKLVNAAKTIQNAYRRYSERQRIIRHDAAKRIQTAFLRYVKRKKVVRKGIDATQARYWQLLRNRSMGMKWTKDSRYYLLFRIPLAYILVCLDVVGGFVESKKKEAKKRVTAEGDKDLEESMEALQQYRCGIVDRGLCTESNRGYSANSSRKRLNFRRSFPRPRNSTRRSL
jgi:hypothetical protein